MTVRPAVVESGYSCDEDVGVSETIWSGRIAWRSWQPQYMPVHNATRAHTCMLCVSDGTVYLVPRAGHGVCRVSARQTVCGKCGAAPCRSDSADI